MSTLAKMEPGDGNIIHCVPAIIADRDMLFPSSRKQPARSRESFQIDKGEPKICKQPAQPALVSLSEKNAPCSDVIAHRLEAKSIVPADDPVAVDQHSPVDRVS